MTTYQKVDKIALKDAVNKQLGSLVTEREVVITGARLIKDGRLELEFAQSRKLRNSKTSALALLNKGDDRFNLNNRQIVRVNHMITLESGKEAFGFDFQPIADAAKDITDSQRVMVMVKIEKIFVEGSTYKLDIRVKESTNPLKLCYDLNIDEEDIESYELKYYNEKENRSENLVNKKGKIIYQWTILNHYIPNSIKDDLLIKEKFLISEFYNPKTRLNLFKVKNKKLVSDSKTTKSNEKVYITRSNLERITRKAKPDAVFDGEIHNRPIYFFSELEIKRLLSVKSFIKNPYAFIENYYLPVITEDSNKYIFEEGSPAYHRRQDCERLNSNFTNFEIPLHSTNKCNRI